MITKADAWEIIESSVESGMADDDTVSLIETLQRIIERQEKADESKNM